MGIEAVLLRHDAPVLALPQVDIQLTAISDANITLLKALAPAIRHLPAQIISQSVQFHRGQRFCCLALHYRPEPAFPFLCSEESRADLAIHGIIFAVPVHNAALRFFRHPFPDQGGQDAVRVVAKIPPVQRSTILIHSAVFIGFKEFRGHGGVQLQRLEGRGQDREAVRPQHQVQAAATVPVHQKVAGVVDALQRPHAPRLHRVGVVFHLAELDPAAHWKLFPQKIQPFF